MVQKLFVQMAIFSSFAAVPLGTAVAEDEPYRIETMLVDNWRFFAHGDADRDGHWSESEFAIHPGYKESGFDKSLKTFIFWMIDDNKDSRISLQEWLNNEIGQFQMGDTDHDGVMSAEEAKQLQKIEDRLFADLAAK
jgi:hypothetical protein